MANTPAAPVPGTPAAVPASAVPNPAVPQAPAQVVQPTPVAPKPGVPATPAPGQTPPVTTVPLHELQQEREKRQQLQSELDNLRRGQPAPQQQYQQPPVQQAYTPVAGIDPKKELEHLWETDPRKAVQVEIMYAMDWRDRVENNLNLQADQLSQRFPDFNNFRSQALSYVRTLPAHQRGAPGIIEASYQMLRGQNVDQLLQQREQEWLLRYQRGEITAQQLQQPAGGSSSPAPMPGGTELTAQQLAAAGAMRMDPMEYAKYIKVSPGGTR